MQNRVAKMSKCKIINFDDVTNENKAQNISYWSLIPDHLYRILIIGGSESGKTNALLNSINNIDQIYLHAKDPPEAKYQYLINKVLNPKAFIEYTNDMHKDVYKNIEEYNLGKKRKLLIVFDGMIADMINKKVVTKVVK